jgi:hypothetical protein
MKTSRHSGAASQEQTRPDQQVERFREVAKELGCDEDVEHFRDKLRVIARQKPKDEPKPPKRQVKARE